jgi:hypothetical protein
MSATVERTRPTSNGQAPQPPSDPLRSAIDTEAQIAARAAEIRARHDGGGAKMTRELFLELWPLAKEPIPPGLIVHTGVVKGKPYESDGVKSVQVQMNRMDAVFTPLYWGYEDAYEEDGKLCLVTVCVFDHEGQNLVKRNSWGGVNQASTLGNLRKGSFTNAAKLAFARVGPGHEIYLGAPDLDPDTNEKVAEQQRPVEAGRAARASLLDRSQAPVEDPEQALAALLAEDHPLAAKRAEANAAMLELGANVGQRLRELRAAIDDRAMNALLDRLAAASERTS